MDKIVEKLAELRVALMQKDLGIGTLEKLSAETKKTFDLAIERVAVNIDFREEVKKRKVQLRQWRVSVFRSFFPLRLRTILSVPFIYGTAIPILLFHLGLEIYHQVCFRLYGIPLVKRKDYFIYDRQLLPYLNWFEKMNCFYCSYYNNLIRYAMEIGARTERYWCPIKYARRMASTHSQYAKFAEYLDAEDFRKKWKELRNFSDLKEADKK